jgi:hypothetical protein
MIYGIIISPNSINRPGPRLCECLRLGLGPNIKIDLREVGWDGRDWIDLAQDRDRWRAYVNEVMNLRVP